MSLLSSKANPSPHCIISAIILLRISIFPLCAQNPSHWWSRHPLPPLGHTHPSFKPVFLLPSQARSLGNSPCTDHRASPHDSQIPAGFHPLYSRDQLSRRTSPSRVPTSEVSFLPCLLQVSSLLFSTQTRLVKANRSQPVCRLFWEALILPCLGSLGNNSPAPRFYLPCSWHGL